MNTVKAHIAPAPVHERPLNTPSGDFAAQGINSARPDITQTSAHDYSIEENFSDRDSSDNVSEYDESSNGESIEEDNADDDSVEEGSEDEERGGRSQPTPRATSADWTRLSIRTRRIQEENFVERIREAFHGTDEEVQLFQSRKQRIFTALVYVLDNVITIDSAGLKLVATVKPRTVAAMGIVKLIVGPHVSVSSKRYQAVINSLIDHDIFPKKAKESSTPSGYKVHVEISALEKWAASNGTKDVTDMLRHLTNKNSKEYRQLKSGLKCMGCKEVFKLAGNAADVKQCRDHTKVGHVGIVERLPAPEMCLDDGCMMVTFRHRARHAARHSRQHERDAITSEA